MIFKFVDFASTYRSIEGRGVERRERTNNFVVESMLMNSVYELQEFEGWYASGRCKDHHCWTKYFLFSQYSLIREQGLLHVPRCRSLGSLDSSLTFSFSLIVRVSLTALKAFLLLQFYCCSAGFPAISSGTRITSQILKTITILSTVITLEILAVMHSCTSHGVGHHRW